jgi:hypothetical protein
MTTGDQILTWLLHATGGDEGRALAAAQLLAQQAHTLAAPLPASPSLELAQDVLLAVQVKLVLANLDAVPAILGQQHLLADLRATREEERLAGSGERGRAARSRRAAARASADERGRTLTFIGRILPSRVIAPGPTATTVPSFSFLPVSGSRMPEAVFTSCTTRVTRTRSPRGISLRSAAAVDISAEMEMAGGEGDGYAAGASRAGVSRSSMASPASSASSSATSGLSVSATANASVSATAHGHALDDGRSG